jgi:hypothetical protein
MSCAGIKRELSAYLDGDLSGARLQLVSAHLESCPSCAQHLQELGQVSDALSSLPRLACPESIAPRVLDRLEVESRGPGLALLFRSAWAARPLIFPSVAPAVLVLVSTLSGVLMMGAHDMRTWASTRRMPASSMETPEVSNGPFASIGDQTAPQTAVDIFFDEQVVGMTEQDIFVMTVVAEDGRVAAVRLLEGDSRVAAPILQQLRLQRGRPGRDTAGKPMEMRSFRLISAMEVRAPLT